MRAPPHTPTNCAQRVLTPAATCCCCADAQAMRVLSRTLRPDAHPLRALATAVARPTLPARKWGGISCYADPVQARHWTINCLSFDWAWTPPPLHYARVLASSGLVRHVAHLVALAGAYVARPALPRSRVVQASLPNSNEPLCMLNRLRELILRRPTAAPTATSSAYFCNTPVSVGAGHPTRARRKFGVWQ